MSDECWCYVAADPKQPGAAWAICVDKPEWAKYTAETLAEWVKDGAQIMRVTKSVGFDMMNKWQRPQKHSQTPDLFPT